MKLFRVVGNVTLGRCHPCYEGAALKLAEPEGLATYGQPASQTPDLTVVWDDLGAGHDQRIAVSDGAEAAQAFRPELKAVDAYCSAILDQVHVDQRVSAQLRFPQGDA